MWCTPDLDTGRRVEDGGGGGGEGITLDVLAMERWRIGEEELGSFEGGM